VAVREGRKPGTKIVVFLKLGHEFLRFAHREMPQR
jgi:hypothetical protein